MEAIKNDIFIFRLGGLTRTATASYYSTRNGGFTEDLVSLYIAAVPLCSTSKRPVLNRAIMYVWLLYFDCITKNMDITIKKVINIIKAEQN